MTTMYDAPMQDFSQDNTMDADMLPSTTSEWLPAENMMEDAESLKPLPQEVDMGHDDVQEYQEFEMNDVDAEFSGDPYAREMSRSELQDQDIPDASRASSPKPLPTLPLQTHSFSGSVETDHEADHMLQRHSLDAEDTANDGKTQASLEASAIHSRDNAEGESTSRPTNDAREKVASEGDVPGLVAEGQENSTISGESAPSPPAPQEEGDDDDQEDPETSGRRGGLESLAHGQSGSYEEDPYEDRDHLDGPAPELTTDDHPPEIEDDGLFMDPPPSVLLSCSLDDSRFAIFNMPGISHSSDGLAVSTAQDSSRSADSWSGQDADRESDIREEHQAVSSVENAESDDPVLLFPERFALYYEPMSIFFEALRGDGDFNAEGRFDENVELVVSAPALGLTLPEDNIYAREVSLHDLNVLHSGCDLSGPLSLQVDLVTPRFGTRYRAIRDEIVRVVSQQEQEEQEEREEQEEGREEEKEPEQQTRLNSGDDYLTGQHEQPEHHDVSASYEHNSERGQPEGPEVSAHSDENHATELHNDGAKDEDDVLDPHGAKESSEGDYPDNVPPVESAAPQEEPENEFQGEEEVYVEGEGQENLYDGEYLEHEDDQHSEQQPDDVKSSHEKDEVASSSSGSGALLDSAEDATHLFDETAYKSGNGQLPDTEDTAEHAYHSPEIFPPPGSVDMPTSSLSPSIQHRRESHSKHLEDESEPYVAASIIETKSRSGSSISHASSGTGGGRDELIAYEDALKDEKQRQVLPDRNRRSESREIPSTTSKRTYDEIELNQLEDTENPHPASVESKRLRSN